MITGFCGCCETCWKPDTWRTGYGTPRSPERRKAASLLRLAASLGDGLPVNLRDASTGIDTRNAGLLIQAVLHANGHRPAASLRQPRT